MAGQQVTRRDRQGELSRAATYECLASIVAPAGWAAQPELPPNPPWQSLVEASSEHAVTLALAWRMAGDERLPPAFRKPLQAALVLGRERNRQMRRHLEAIGGMLNQAGVVPLLLKGASYLARYLYPDDGIRYMGDLDLLVPEEALDDARAALERHGFVSVGAEGMKRDHHHLPKMQRSDWDLSVELHRRPAVNRWCSILDEKALLGGASPIAIGEARFLLPSETHSVVTGIIHGQLQDQGHRLKRPWLRALLDFARQVEVFGAAIDWREIEARFAAQPGVLAELLVLAEHLMAVPLPLPVDDRARRAPVRMARALDRGAARRVLSTTGYVALRALQMMARLHELRPRSFSRSNWRRRFEPYGRRW